MSSDVPVKQTAEARGAPARSMTLNVLLHVHTAEDLAVQTNHSWQMMMMTTMITTMMTIGIVTCVLHRFHTSSPIMLLLC